MALDLSKPVKTRDGLSVRIICTDAIGEDPIVGLVRMNAWHEKLIQWQPDGRFLRNCEDGLDLLNAPVRREGWINIFPSRKKRTDIEVSSSYDAVFFDTEYLAKSCAFKDAKTIRIEWEE